MQQAGQPRGNHLKSTLYGDLVISEHDSTVPGAGVLGSGPKVPRPAAEVCIFLYQNNAKLAARPTAPSVAAMTRICCMPQQAGC